MSITLEKYELAELLRDASEVAIKRYRIEKGEERPWMSQKQAHDLYGRGTVDRWVREGLLKRNKDGGRNSTIRYDKIQIETLARSSNRTTYLSCKERN